MELKTVTYTNSKCSDIWPMYFGQLLKHSHYSGYVLSDIVTGAYPEQKFVKYENRKPYYIHWLKALDIIGEEYFIYMQDDFILYADVNFSAMENYLNFLENNREYSFVRLIKSGIFPEESIGGGLYAVKSDFLNIFAMQATIWRKRDFARIYENAKCRKWTDEERCIRICRKLGIKGAYAYNGESKRGTAHWDSGVFPYIATALIKGKWNFGEYEKELKPLLEKYKIDAGQRGYYL